MIFGIWILLSFFLLHSAPQFVVRELRACCHHPIDFRCPEKDFKIAVIQARYIPQESEGENVAALKIDPTSLSFEEEDDEVNNDGHIGHHPFIHPSTPSLSLWDLDVKFSHEFSGENVPKPYNTLPEWHPDHASHSQIRTLFSLPKKVKLPPKFPSGANFSKKILEMPDYALSFLDMRTIWRQPLWPIVQEIQLEPQPVVFSKYSKEERKQCLSYETLMRDGKPEEEKVKEQKISWQYKDLRTYFNKRCSGKWKCELPENKEEELRTICRLSPNGKIVIKYICFNASAELSNSRCNIDVSPATEGFLMNPGYPELYPGDIPCGYRVQVPLQKILLIFFDISLRAEDKKRGCRDALIVRDGDSETFSTCGDSNSAVALLSQSSTINITLAPQSRLAFPKRGFLAYYRVIGCSAPPIPQHSYLVSRNATMASIICDVGHIFPDTLSRFRTLYCSPLDHRWLGTFPFCNDIRNWKGRNSSIEELLARDPSVWPLRQKTSYFTSYYFTEFVLPLIVFCLVFLFHGFIFYLIWRQRSRLEELENAANVEVEKLCLNDGESIFSFPDSLWDFEDGEEEEETDLDKTLTLQTDTPNSSDFKPCSPEERIGLRNGGRIGNGHLKNGNGYVHGIPLVFNGYFRQTAV